MKLLSPLQTPTFNLLSLGERGVGKTVFLVGSYAELNRESQTDNADTTDSKSAAATPKLWFESLYPAERELLDSILNYISQTGHYPPPTLKITDFHFAFKQRQRFGVKTLCHFRWWDIPGEYCNFENPYYQTMVLNSHSCCVFINADRLINDPSYQTNLETLTKQVISLARLVEQGMASYRFALIFTQCDRLAGGKMGSLQIEERIQGLVDKLDAVHASYQRFYSGVPISDPSEKTANEKENYRLEAHGVAAAFLWLVAELYKKQSQIGNDVGTLENSLNKDPNPLNTFTPGLALTLTGIIGGLLLTLGGLALFYNVQQGTTSRSVDSAPVFDVKTYERLVKEEPSNLQAHVELANAYLETGELEKAVPLLQQIISLDPNNLEWRYNLAKLYELSSEFSQAEGVYDELLANDPKDVQALVGKALLRQAQGDTATAQSLFTVAESLATSPEWKQRIQELSKQAAASGGTTPDAPPPSN